MRLALNLGYMVGGETSADQLRLTRHAEQLGFDSVWAAEAYGADVVTLLSWLAAQTTTIHVGSAVMQIPGRTPANTAMTAAGLQNLSGGRFRLGLGVSGPQVSEGWHGIPFAKPLGRTRDYVAIVRKALARETVEYAGDHFQLPLPGSEGKGLKLMIRPVAPVPVYLAGTGPKNLELTGEIADGWLGLFYAPHFARAQLDAIAAGRAKVAKDMTGFDVQASFPLVVGDDVAACADPVRPYAALYVGGMGSRQNNFYNNLAVRMGYAAEAAEIQDLYLTGHPREAMAKVPAEFIDDTSLLGDRARLTDRLTALAESGLTTCAVTPVGRVLEEKLAALETLAEAHRAG
ncbi:MAG: LLM class F420-dependent oxidoreductase [Propionibacteriaceae bacterium]|nr:LLM class F420-dependent oxidoreductase [Propionibacteriaceae bacterium]